MSTGPEGANRSSGIPSAAPKAGVPALGAITGRFGSAFESMPEVNLQRVAGLLL
jgi:hypothetical protein